MDEKKTSTIEKIYKLTQQDTEFNKELRKKLNLESSSEETLLSNNKINHIYEYCIEAIIRKQAEEFYKEFPINKIIPTLIEDFIRMESFRREDNFADFSLALYQQIECITNHLCERKDLSEIVEKMWAYPAYVKQEKDTPLKLENRPESNYTIASLIFYNKDLYEKSQKTLQCQYAMDKIRIIVYYLGYMAKMRNSDYDNYKEFTGLLSDIYQCRNINHRGNSLTEWEIKTLNRIVPMKSFYYFKFMGVLSQYIEYIKEGIAHLPELEEYAKKLPVKKIILSGPKIVNYINLDNIPKK